MNFLFSEMFSFFFVSMAMYSVNKYNVYHMFSMCQGLVNITNTPENRRGPLRTIKEMQMLTSNE